MAQADRLLAAFQRVASEFKAVRGENGKRVYRIVWTGSAYSEARPATSVVPAGYCDYVGPTTPPDWLPGDSWNESAV